MHHDVALGMGLPEVLLNRSALLFSNNTAKFTAKCIKSKVKGSQYYGTCPQCLLFNTRHKTSMEGENWCCENKEV